MQIFHALGAVVGGLGGRITDAFQDWAHGHCRERREQLGDERGLVESALAFARRMQRHGDNDVEMPAAQARVVETFAEPFRDGITEVALLSVFELMQNSPNETAATVGGDGAIEMEGAMFAVGAAEGLGDRARKRL